MIAAFALVFGGSASAATLTVGGGVDLGTSVTGVKQGVTTGQLGTTLESFTGNTTTLVSVSTSFSINALNVAGRHAEPANDTSPYLYLRNQNASGTITFPIPAGQRIDYIGFYLGTVDPYNFFRFKDAQGNDIPIAFGGPFVKSEVSGTDIAVTAGGFSAAALNDYRTIPSLYVNVAFASNEQVASIIVRQTSYATELDNLTFRLVPIVAGAAASTNPSAVDAPGGLLFAGLGFGVIALRRRR